MLSFNSDMESGTTLIKEIQEKDYQKQIRFVIIKNIIKGAK